MDIFRWLCKTSSTALRTQLIYTEIYAARRTRNKKKERAKSFCFYCRYMHTQLVNKNVKQEKICPKFRRSTLLCEFDARHFYRCVFGEYLAVSWDFFSFCTAIFRFTPVSCTNHTIFHRTRNFYAILRSRGTKPEDGDSSSHSVCVGRSVTDSDFRAIECCV